MTSTERQEAVKSKKVPTDQSSAHQATNQTEDGHVGATEDEVASTPAPSGNAFEDEPKQG